MEWKNAITNPPEESGNYYAVVTTIRYGTIFDECEVRTLTYDVGSKEWDDGAYDIIEETELVILWQEIPKPSEVPSLENIIDSMK